MAPKRLVGKRIYNLVLVALLALFSGLAACEDDGVVPDVGLEEADLVGTYDATTLVVTEDGTETDVLAEGGELTLVLNSDDTMSGRLFVPEGAEDGSDLDESLDGTWNFQDATDDVTVDLTNDVFLNDVVFDASETGDQAELSADEDFADFGLTVVLMQR